VYFAPPNYHLLLDKGPQLALSVDELVHFSRPSIDVLFQSAADIYRKRLMGIILSGANQDGTAGLAAVHRAGGVTIVQEPDTAQVPQMVASALKQTPADYVLPLDQIGTLLKTLPSNGPQPIRVTG
jgi:two-component system chemotaxis response regulator CheB